MDGWIDALMDGWMDGWISAWVGEDGWMDGWREACRLNYEDRSMKGCMGAIIISFLQRVLPVVCGSL